MRRACIDIGSNTTRLLVADCDDHGLRAIAQERAFTQLGRAGDGECRIAATKLQEIAVAVTAQFRRARELGAEQVRCVATAGVRRASNGDALARLVAGFCDGLELEILSAAQEADLAFRGAVWASAPDPGATVAVVDAGGGSTELVVGTPPADVRWWESVPIGSGDVTARWLQSDPPSAESLERAARGLAELFMRIEAPAPVGAVIAVGGSATTLRMLAGPVLDAQSLARMLAAMDGLSAAEISARFNVDVRRARLLAGGLLVLRAVSECFNSPLLVGGGGLREGVLLSVERGA